MDAAADRWGEYEHSATTERLDLAAELARWSGIATAASTGAGPAPFGTAADGVAEPGRR